MKTAFDINKSPMVVIWEMNRTSDMPASCCATGSREECDVLELSTRDAEKFLCDVSELRPPVFVFAGDPLRRQDVYLLVHRAARLGLHPVMAPASSDLDRNTIVELKHAGLSRLQLTLDRIERDAQDTQQEKYGCFAATLQTLQWAREWRLPVQINTHVSRHNMDDLERLAGLLKTFSVLLWNVTFPMPGDPAHADELLSADEFEAVFARLYKLSQQVPFKIKTTEANHYRRFVLQQRARTKADNVRKAAELGEGIPGIMPIHEARATVFISHAGEVYPGAHLPVSAGNVRFQKLADIYRDSEIFVALRDVSRLTGKCGLCSFKQICGGSRARALATLGDMFTEDVSCIYTPASASRSRKRPAPPQRVNGAIAEQPN